MITNWSAEIAAAKNELKLWAARQLAQLFLWTLTAKASALGDNDAVESSDEGQDPGTLPPGTPPKGQRKVIRIQPFGFNSMPPTKLRGLTLRLGMSNMFFIGIGPTQAYGPQNLNPGETVLYNSKGCTILEDQNGNIIITPTGSGTVQIAGNAYALPQWDSFATALKTMTAAVAALTAATDLASVITLANGMRTAIAALDTSMTTNTNYKSTKAKNG